MSKSSRSRETAKAMVRPLFAWNAAVLKGGEMMIDSLAAAARNVRVAVLDTDTAPRKPRKTKSSARRARRRRR